MNLQQTSRGVILLDGALYEDAFAWLYQEFPGHQPMPLLIGTPYEPIAAAGPILLDAPEGSPAHAAWRHGSQFEDGLWLESDANTNELWRILRRRLRVFAPDHRELWLRLSDARPMRRVWLAGRQWPEGFWHLIRGVWLRHENRIVRAWDNAAPQTDMAPHERGIPAQVTLDWPLLAALSTEDDTTQDVYR